VSKAKLTVKFLCNNYAPLAKTDVRSPGQWLRRRLRCGAVIVVVVVGLVRLQARRVGGSGVPWPTSAIDPESSGGERQQLRRRDLENSPYWRCRRRRNDLGAVQRRESKGAQDQRGWTARKTRTGYSGLSAPRARSDGGKRPGRPSRPISGSLAGRGCRFK
jgi:hypothetical protein